MLKGFLSFKYPKKSNLVNCSQDCNQRLNEVNIQMINEKFRNKLFNNQTSRFVDQDSINSLFEKFKIDNKKSTISNVIDFELPQMLANNIEGHLNEAANVLNKPYTDMLSNINASWEIPALPNFWEFKPGWAKYDSASNTVSSVSAPDEDLLFFDVEILVKESKRAVMAVALGRLNWYSWTNPSLIDRKTINDDNLCTNDLVHLHSPDDRNRPKCVIGHFVSFDRARISEEYNINGTGTRFLDTMALHIAISGMTSMQRSLKSSYNKKTIDNKLWKKYYARRRDDEEISLESIQMSEKWINDASFNSLLDVYTAYFPYLDLPQNKDKRNTFVEGTTEDVVNDFQNLMKYCATDVLMTADIFRKMWPIYLERFPHPATLTGMLQMGSLYLPVNDNWNKYINETRATYDNTVKFEKDFLKKIARETLEFKHENKFSSDPWLWDLDWKYTKVSPFPKWYRDLISKTDNSALLETCPESISSQMRVAVKLLRLKWDGLPLHYDKKMKWGVLIPGKHSDSVDDSKYMDIDGNMALDIVPVERHGTVKSETLHFPFRNYLKFWIEVFIKRLESLEHYLKSKRNISSKLVQFVNQMSEDIRILPISDPDKERLCNIINRIKTESKWHITRKFDDEDDSYNIYNLQINGFDKLLLRAPNSKMNPDIPFCWFHGLPHEDGDSSFVGSPLSKSFLNHIQSGRLTSDTDNDTLMRILEGKKSCVYWRNYHKRIESQMVVKTTGNDSAILPQVVVSGTVTRRAVENLWLTATNATKERVGSELKSMVQPPTGWVLVGADVDSQEQWIAAVLGDSLVGIHGGTPFGFLVLQGSKSSGTDLHSVTSKEIGISRDAAKILNYARMYGAGVKKSKETLLKYNPELTPLEAHDKIVALMKHTKGRRTDSGWVDGIESNVFSKLEEVACSELPITPVLSAQLSKSLVKGAVDENFMTSRCNWVVQSSGVDYLHCLITFSQCLIDQYSVTARLCMSIHDEIRYLCVEQDKYRMALILQIANLYTRAVFASKLNLNDLPQSVAFFSEVDIDYCLRKNPSDDCVTPSNRDGLHKSYNIAPGESLNIEQILEKTGGKLT